MPDKGHILSCRKQRVKILNCTELSGTFSRSGIVVLGGGIIKACGDFIPPIIKKAADANPFLAGSNYIRLSITTGDDALFWSGGLLQSAKLLKCELIWYLRAGRG